MEIRVEGPDEFGNAAYADLFLKILTDLGKSRTVEEALIVQRPEEMVFIYSIRLRTKPERRLLSDVASLREEGKDTRLVINEEVYAPAILSLLWERYRRERVDQLTRYEISVKNVPLKELEQLEVFSGEKVKNEIIDAVWRCLPEGMKARHNITSDNVITILATEEKMTAELKEEARKVHQDMGGSINV